MDQKNGSDGRETRDNTVRSCEGRCKTVKGREIYYGKPLRKIRADTFVMITEGEYRLPFCWDCYVKVRKGYYQETVWEGVWWNPLSWLKYKRVWIAP